MESIIKSRIDPILNKTQNCLQRGFTEKVSSLNAALIVSEAHHYADAKNLPFYIATLDAEKAFDTVHHEILFNKIFHDGINGDMWILLRNLYRDMSVKVKWKGATSDLICLKQGIRQGAKLSTTLYKRYNNTILDSITRSQIGASVGTLMVSSPTCADDIALIANSRAELQGLLDLVQYNTNRDLVKINATKSEIVTSTKAKDKDSFTFNGQNIEQTSSTKHLGITRTKYCKVNIDERLQSGRRTIYALLGPGLKSMVGLSPIVALKIWKTYALPRCIYGMETQTYSMTDMERLERQQRKICRQLQQLPESCASTAVYALLGVEPIETAIDKNTLSLFLGIARLTDSVKFKILQRELYMADTQDQSFICRVRKILKKYALPPPESIFDAPPKKACWKNMVRNATSNYWYKEWFRDTKEKSSIQYLQLQNNPIHNPHNIWKVVNHKIKDVKKAQVKAKLVTNTYRLQSVRAKFNQHAVKSTCVICNEGDEDIEHFILRCKSLNTTRIVYLKKLQSLIESIKGVDIRR